MDATLAWAIISGMALAIAGMAAYIVKLHASRVKSEKEHKEEILKEVRKREKLVEEFYSQVADE